MSFSLHKSISLLERTPVILKSLLYELPEEWVMVNEGPETWSAFDVVGHLIQGERTDWITRAKIILRNKDDKTFEPFDRFAQKKLSAGKTIEQLLDEFAQLRNKNIEELNSWNLTEADLEKVGNHPALGTVTLKQLIATWTIHDLSHLHQISRVMVKHYSGEVGPWFQYFSILNRGDK